MNNINVLKKMSYLKFKELYYQLLLNKEIEFSNLNQNYEMAKKISKTYFTEPGYDKENEEIYDREYQLLSHCLMNIKEWKRLEKEIMDVKAKMLKAELKLSK